MGLFGPPALPDSLSQMSLPSLKSYCRELAEFEQAINADLRTPLAEGCRVTSGNSVYDHYRAIITQFFAHHALDAKYEDN